MTALTGRYAWPDPDPADTAPDPDQPVPFTLTPKAHAELDTDGAPPGPGEWACGQCGAAFFGTVPEGGLCPACRAGTGEP